MRVAAGARAFAESGYRVLAFDFAGYGTSLLEFGADAPKVRSAVRRFIADHTRG